MTAPPMTLERLQNNTLLKTHESAISLPHIKAGMQPYEQSINKHKVNILAGLTAMTVSRLLP